MVGVNHELLLIFIKFHNITKRFAGDFDQLQLPPIRVGTYENFIMKCDPSEQKSTNALFSEIKFWQTLCSNFMAKNEVP